MQETVESGTTELDNYAADRRRALHELNDRIRRREKQLAELIEREEAEATRRIQAAFVDGNAASSSSSSVYSARNGELLRCRHTTVRRRHQVRARRSGERLSRELDRSVEGFARAAQTVLADRLTQVGTRAPDASRSAWTASRAASSVTPLRPWRSSSPACLCGAGAAPAARKHGGGRRGGAGRPRRPAARARTADRRGARSHVTACFKGPWRQTNPSRVRLQDGETEANRGDKRGETTEIIEPEGGERSKSRAGASTC